MARLHRLLNGGVQFILLALGKDGSIATALKVDGSWSLRNSVPGTVFGVLANNTGIQIMKKEGVTNTNALIECQRQY